MSTIKFGWHVPSFPVDGSNGDDFLRRSAQHSTSSNTISIQPGSMITSGRGPSGKPATRPTPSV